MSAREIRIATRKSMLALWQADHIANLLAQRHPGLRVELVHVVTQGDRDQSGALSDFGGTGAFTREVQRAVLDGRADLAVHSLKDLPTERAEGLLLACVPERAPARDALVFPTTFEGETTLDALPDAACIGTGSPRRQAQLRHRRPDLNVEGVRGNVDTRLRKLDAGEFDAIVLAEAGLRRLGFENRIGCVLAPPVMYHAVGQGALGIECRADDAATRELLEALIHEPSFAAVRAERALLAALRAGCHAPVGVETRVGASTIELTGVVLTPDGSRRLEATGRGERSAPEELGRRVAAALESQGAGAIISSTA